MKNLRFVVPNAITAAALACGVVSILHATAGRPHEAAWWILYATLLDRMDGAAARALNASSPFGAQLDSFSDFVSFGLAPAFLFIGACGLELTVWSVAPMLIFVVGAAVRLARFTLGDHDGVYDGVASTMAGGVYATWVVVAVQLVGEPLSPVLFGGALAVLGVLMNVPWIQYNRVGAGPSSVQRYGVAALALICAVCILTRRGSGVLMFITTGSLIFGPLVAARNPKEEAAVTS